MPSLLQQQRYHFGQCLVIERRGFFRSDRHCHCIVIAMCNTKKTAKSGVKVLNFKKAPAAIGGLALSNVGMALMVNSVSRGQFDSTSMAMLGVLYSFISLGFAMVLLYFIRLASDPVAYFHSDFSSPSNISTVGTIAMAICLMGRALQVVDFPANVCASIVYFGAFIQATNMIPFFVSCWKTSTWPEPFWNNAIHSSLLTSVCLRGDDNIAVACRAISLTYGLTLLIPNFSIMTVRTLFWNGKNQQVVANNPGVVMIQSCCSITCSGWLISPLTESASSGIGGIIGHVLFALSTFGFCCAMYGAFQRRVVLLNFGEHPSWVAITFPFTNSALAAGQYLKTHPNHSYVLFVWTLMISTIAAICVLGVNVLYFKNWFYLFSEEELEASTTQEDDTEAAKSGTPSMDSLFGTI